VFISDPSFNVVHREILERDGVSFKSHRAESEQNREFLSTSDIWFRPTTLKIGPDGALYIADMYRFVIEHPEWIPADVQKNMNLRAGEDKGRIYRVYPKGSQLRPIPNLKTLSTDKLVAALDSPNGWQRDTVQQLLYWRNEKQSADLLRQLIDQSKRPITRAQALWTLENLNAVNEQDVLRGFKDEDSRVRAQSLRISESLKASETIANSAAELALSENQPLAFQAILTLGEFPFASATPNFAKAARAHAGDARFRNAILSSAPAHLNGLFADIAQNPPRNAAETKLFTDYFALAKSSAVIERAINALQNAQGAWRFAALAELIDKGQVSKSTLDAARKLAEDETAAEFDRVQAIRLVRDINSLGALLRSTSLTVQKAALAQVGKSRGPEVAETIIKAWAASSPSLRQDALNMLFTRPEWIDTLLAAIEQSKISANVIDASRQQMLRNHSSRQIADRARKIFSTTDPNRRATLAKYESVKTLHGDAANGQVLFKQNCAQCHRFQNEGATLGPDLGSVAEKPADYLLSAILDPNQAVEARYVGYTAIEKDDSEFTGVITSETGNSVTLTAASDLKKTLLRSELKELKSTGKSLMPEGLENALTPQSAADLIAFLRSQIRPKGFPGNEPRMMQPSVDGTIHLTAGNAEIYGDTLVFEPNYRNLGYWESESDRAVWIARLPKDGSYDVYLNYSVPEERQNNRVRVEAGAAQIVAPIKATGSWDKYELKKIGSIDLRAGDQTITIRGEKPFRGPLLDVKEIVLAPAGKPLAQ
jgi:putative heme-binding domain-containing protein